MQNYLRFQTHNGFAKAFQINIFERMRDMLKLYMRRMASDNLKILVCILEVFIALMMGPCQDNQKEMILKKVIGLIDEIHANLFKFSDATAPDKGRAMLALLKLRLAMLENCTDNVILKTLSLSFNPDLLWTRISQIYDVVFVPQLTSKELKKLKGEDLSESFITDKKSSTLRYDTRETDFRESLTLKSGETQSLTKKETNLMKKNRLMFQGDDYTPIVKEGLFIIIYMFQLSEYESAIGDKIKDSHERLSASLKNLKKAAGFFRDNIATIEIVDEHKNLQTIYFYLHPITKYLSSYTKSKFEYDIERKNSTTKLVGLMDQVDLFYFEMKHFSRINKIGIRANLSYLFYLKLFNFVLAIFLNLTMLLQGDINKEENGAAPFLSWSESTPTERFLQFLGYVILFSYLGTLVVWFAFDFFVKRELFFKRAKETMNAEIRNYLQVKGLLKMPKDYQFYKSILMYLGVAWKFLSQTSLTVIVLYLLITILGLGASKFFFSLLLLEVVYISPMLWNVIKSMTLNLASLSGTALFALIMMFIYTSFVFYSSDSIVTELGLIDQPDVQFCESFSMCFLNMVSFGIKAGGGIGEVLVLPSNTKEKTRYFYRTMFDIVFFVTIVLLVLNIILGIIIDSFAELRNRREQIGRPSSRRKRHRQHLLHLRVLQRRLPLFAGNLPQPCQANAPPLELRCVSGRPSRERHQRGKDRRRGARFETGPAKRPDVVPAQENQAGQRAHRRR